ncbi:MAG: hypothetical protein AAFX06_32905 [Planctomycetota bacterium]
MPFSSPSPGDNPFDSILSARFLRVLTEVANLYEAGRLQNAATPVVATRNIRIENGTGSDIEKGQLLHIESLDAPASQDVLRARNSNPITVADEPAWHTNIANVTPTITDVPDGQFIEYPTEPWALVQLGSTAAGATDFLMVDPANPTKMKAASSGIYRTIGYDEANMVAIADLTQSQPFWHYELLEDPKGPATTRARLLGTDGVPFTTGAAFINLSDPLGILSDSMAEEGYQGICQQVGNRFEDRGGPCP